MTHTGHPQWLRRPRAALARTLRATRHLGVGLTRGVVFGAGILLTLLVARAFVEPGTSPGTSGNQSTGAALYPMIAGGVQTYTTPGTYTWTKPAGVTKVYVTLVGGGGGAGGWAGGGGGEAYSRYPVSVSADVTVTVGAAGTGAAGTGAGFPGGNSSFGSLTALGGGGGPGGAGSSGGLGGGGDNGLSDVLRTSGGDGGAYNFGTSCNPGHAAGSMSGGGCSASGSGNWSGGGGASMLGKGGFGYSGVSCTNGSGYGAGGGSRGGGTQCSGSGGYVLVEW